MSVKDVKQYNDMIHIGQYCSIISGWFQWQDSHRFNPCYSALLLRCPWVRKYSFYRLLGEHVHLCEAAPWLNLKKEKSALCLGIRKTRLCVTPKAAGRTFRERGGNVWKYSLYRQSTLVSFNRNGGRSKTVRKYSLFQPNSWWSFPKPNQTLTTAA